MSDLLQTGESPLLLSRVPTNREGSAYQGAKTVEGSRLCVPPVRKGVPARKATEADPQDQGGRMRVEKRKASAKVCDRAPAIRPMEAVRYPAFSLARAIQSFAQGV